jgi:hypothetical protein
MVCASMSRGVSLVALYSAASARTYLHMLNLGEQGGKNRPLLGFAFLSSLFHFGVVVSKGDNSRRDE